MPVNYITDEVKAMIGTRNGPILAYHPVEASEVRRFFQAIMDPAPRYWDEAWAASSRYGGLVAPPAYPPHHFRRPPTDPDPLEQMRQNPDSDGLVRTYRGLPPVKLPLKRMLNGGYEYEFFRYARVGERIYRCSSYVDIYQRDGKSGPMVFIISSDRYTTDAEVPLITATTTSIWR